jgi:hypothetical protein
MDRAVKTLYAVLLSLPLVAQAQTCLPAYPSASENPKDWVQPFTNVTWHGTPMQSGITPNGAWVRWACVELSTGATRRVSYVANVSEFSKIGGRLTTIMGSADPLKSLQTLPSRVTVLPITDPSLAKIVADMNAVAW